MAQHVMVTASAVCETPEAATRAVEALARVAAGLALEGQMIAVNAMPYDPEED